LLFSIIETMISLPRKKKTNYLLKILYFVKNYVPISARHKARFFADLEWIFSRFALELSFSIYDHSSHPLRSNIFLLSKLGSVDSILDVGCGNGELAAQMYKSCSNITGIDISVSAIYSARARFPWINFVHCKAEDLPLERYELVVFSHVLEHLDDPIALLKKAKNIATLIYIEVPDYDSTFLNQLRVDLGSDLIYSDNDHVSEFKREDISEMLAACDLCVLNSEARFGSIKFWCSSVQ